MSRKRRIALPPRVVLPFLGVLALGAAGSPADAVDATDELGPAPGSYTIAPEADSIRIPFELWRDDIRMTGRIHGRTVRMLVDNGALWDELLFFGSPRVDALDLPREGSVQVGGAGSGAERTADYGVGVALELDGLDGRTITFRDQAAIIMPYDPAAPNPWAGSEGQISSALFKNFAVSFDFDAGIMTLVPAGAFADDGARTEIPIAPNPTSNSWTLPGVLTLEDGRRLSLDVTMDLGWDEPVAINTGQAHDIQVPPGLRETGLGWGAQGEIRGYRGTVPSLELGGYRFENAPATYATVESGGSKVDEVMVGMGILSRFHITFDYPHRRVLIAPNRRFDTPFAAAEPQQADP